MDLNSLTAGEYERLSMTGLRAFFAIASEWGLDEDAQMDLLGLSGRTSLQQLMESPPTHSPLEQLERISHVLGIYRSLHLLLPSSDQANSWVKKPNAAPLFRGLPAITVMRQGASALLEVRAYLESELA